MGKIVLTRKAALVQGALMGYLGPKLAADASINLTPILAKLTSKNYADHKASVAAEIKKVTTGKLAADAKLDDMHQFLDSLDKEEPAEGVDIDPNSGLPMAELPKEGEDEDEPEARKFLRSKLSEDDMEAYDKLCASAMDAEETPEEKAAREKKEAADKKAKDAEMEEKNKKAMDGAIKAAITANDARHRAIREAERVVRPFVGEIDTLAFDSAEDVYKKACEMKGVKTDGVHPSAFRAILEAQPRPDARPQLRVLAADAATLKDAAEMAPGLARIKIGA